MKENLNILLKQQGKIDFKHFEDPKDLIQIFT